jgi:lipopolysaccharide heptosyltransferase I
MRALPGAIVAGLADHGRGLAIGIVRLGALGDILRTLPPVRLLRIHLPDARIHWVCDDRWAGILARHRELDATIEFPRRGLQQGPNTPSGWIAAARALGAFRTALRGARFDLVLDFHGNLRSGLAGRLSGAPVRLGFEGHQQREGNRFCTTHRVAEGPRRRSRMERNLDLIRALGVPDGPLPDAGLPRSAEAARAAREITRSLGGADAPYAILNPGASPVQAYKKPPAELLAAAARPLAAAGILPIVVHGPGELEDARAVEAMASGAAHIAPPTDLATLTALLRGARLFVGGDTGPLHLACAVGCPVIAIYGPTDPIVNAPWGVPARIVVPPGRVYTGVKRVDRQAGGFDGVRPGHLEEAVEAMLADARESA